MIASASPAAAAARTAAPAPAARLTAVDALRGLVMVIMALDHVRDFFHAGAMVFQPEDLTRTTQAVFFTRWVTHICAPSFFLLAGIGAWLRFARDGSKPRLSRFLWTRGVWLIVVELIVMRLAMNFTWSSQYPVILLILWALGLSMIALAALIYLPLRVLAVLSISIIALHNLLDGIQAGGLGAFEGLWRILHQPGFFMPAGVPIVVAYPVLPWIGVIAAGFCLGSVFSRPAPERRQLLVRLGLASIAAFLALRAVNVYGNPVPWASQPSPVFTLLSFLNTTKYPPSLQFLLMTLGPSLLLLAYFDRRQLPDRNPLVVIGRVPFFYYVLHFWLIHILASIMAYVSYGADSFTWLFSPLPSMGGAADTYPPGFGYPLWVTYVVWIAVVLMLYPLCVWFAGVKKRSRAWWLGYL
jgi:uncharacterized membrane protein